MYMPSASVKDLLTSLAGAHSVGVFAKAVGSDPNIWGVYIGKQPDATDTSLDRAITLYDSGGSDPNPAYAVDYPSVQIRVRAASGQYPDAWNKANQIQALLLGIPSMDLNGDRLVSITQRGQIFFAGFDPKNRPEFTLNYRLIIEPALEGYAHRDPV